MWFPALIHQVLSWWKQSIRKSWKLYIRAWGSQWTGTVAWRRPTDSAKNEGEREPRSNLLGGVQPSYVRRSANRLSHEWSWATAVRVHRLSLNTRWWLKLGRSSRATSTSMELSPPGSITNEGLRLWLHSPVVLQHQLPAGLGMSHWCSFG